MKTNHQKRLLTMPSLAVLAAQLLLLPAFAGDNLETPGSLSAADYKFAKAAAHGGIMEVKLGKIALVNSQNPAVQQFGERMVTEHGKAGKELLRIATNKGAVLPDQVTAKQLKEVDRLTKLNGPEFDRAYIALMVKDHRADQKEFQKAADEANDPDVKAFAVSTLTIVKVHLKSAEDLELSLRHAISSNN